MPQLDIIFISTIYMWTWIIIMMMTRKIKTITFNNTPETNTTHNKTKQTPMLPWT